MTGRSCTRNQATLPKNRPSDVAENRLGMFGENQAFIDMDAVNSADLRQCVLALIPAVVFIR